LQENVMSDSYELPGSYQPVAAIGVEPRARFISRTYNHLMAAIVGFTLFEVFLFQSGMAESIARTLLGGSWLLVLGGFMVVSWMASRRRPPSRSAASMRRSRASSWPRASSSCRCSTSRKPTPPEPSRALPP
jgi:hypothetical protein